MKGATGLIRGGGGERQRLFPERTRGGCPSPKEKEETNIVRRKRGVALHSLWEGVADQCKRGEGGDEKRSIKRTLQRRKEKRVPLGAESRGKGRKKNVIGSSTKQKKKKKKRGFHHKKGFNPAERGGRDGRRAKRNEKGTCRQKKNALSCSGGKKRKKKGPLGVERG